MQRRPTSFDIAALAGVSQPTVSRALSGHPSVSAQTRARVLAAAKTMSGQAKAPNAQVDVLARAGLAKIEQGAAACVTGDAGGGKRLIAEGLAERTAATEPFDETLEGE